MMTENTAYQAPESNLDNQQDEVEMTLKEIYFSFNGRVPRKVFWVYGFLGMFGAYRSVCLSVELKQERVKLYFL